MPDIDKVLDNFTGQTGGPADRAKRSLQGLARQTVELTVENHAQKMLLTELVVWVELTGVLKNPALAGMNITALQNAVKYLKDGTLPELPEALKAKLSEANARINGLTEQA